MIKELNPERMVVMSNCSKENDDFFNIGKYLNGVDITPFTQSKIPDILEERLVQIHKSTENSPPHHQMPTISSLLKEGKVNAVVGYAVTRKSQKTFVEKLKESIRDVGKSHNK
jgi:hypothetical protein